MAPPVRRRAPRRDPSVGTWGARLLVVELLDDRAAERVHRFLLSEPKMPSCFAISNGSLGSGTHAGTSRGDLHTLTQTRMDPFEFVGVSWATKRELDLCRDLFRRHVSTAGTKHRIVNARPSAAKLLRCCRRSAQWEFHDSQERDQRRSTRGCARHDAAGCSIRAPAAVRRWSHVAERAALAGMSDASLIAELCAAHATGVKCEERNRHRGAAMVL